MIRIKRAYEAPAVGDGPRMLVDQVWPRGVSRDALEIARWERDVAPTNELHRWFGHDPARWVEFRERYTGELASPAPLPCPAGIAGEARTGTVTLASGARDTEHNQAVVRKEDLDRLAREQTGERA